MKLGKRLRQYEKKMRAHVLGSALYFVSLILVWQFTPIMFGLGTLTGLGFLLCCAVVFYRGMLLDQPAAVALLAAGYLVSAHALRALSPQIRQSLLAESFLTAAVLGLLFTLLYLHGNTVRGKAFTSR